jgi:hypothetical protein
MYVCIFSVLVIFTYTSGSSVAETMLSEGFTGKVNGGAKGMRGIKERRKGDEELRYDVRCSPVNLNSRLHFLVISKYSRRLACG